MAQHTELIAKLNAVLSWELAGIIQNLNHSMVLTGKERINFVEFFSDNSKENRTHAEQIGQRIAALGGIPTVEPAKIRQAVTLDAMLEAALALELDAMQAWEAALDASGNASRGLQFWLEDMVSEEQEHIDDLRMITKKVSFRAEQLPGASQAG